MDKIIFNCAIKQPWQKINDFNGKTSLVPSYLKRHVQSKKQLCKSALRCISNKNILLSQESYSILQMTQDLLQMTQDLLQHEHQERMSGTIYLQSVSFLWGMRIPLRILGTG